jgi:hypothetical protein
LEPQQGKPRFGEGSEPIWRRPPPDQLVNWCKAHNITPKVMLWCIIEMCLCLTVPNGMILIILETV